MEFAAAPPQTHPPSSPPPPARPPPHPLAPSVPCLHSGFLKALGGGSHLLFYTCRQVNRPPQNHGNRQEREGKKIPEHRRRSILAQPQRRGHTDWGRGRPGSHPGSGTHSQVTLKKTSQGKIVTDHLKERAKAGLLVGDSDHRAGSSLISGLREAPPGALTELQWDLGDLGVIPGSCSCKPCLWFSSTVCRGQEPSVSELFTLAAQGASAVCSHAPPGVVAETELFRSSAGENSLMSTVVLSSSMSTRSIHQM